MRRLRRTATSTEAQAKKLWAYLVEGGAENLADALRFCAWLIGEGDEPEEARALPSAGVYARACAIRRKRPTAAIVFYRALMQAGQTEPVDALVRSASRARARSAAALRVEPEGEGRCGLRRR